MTLAVTALERRTAIRQAQAVERATVAGKLETAKFLDGVRRKAIATYKRGGVFDIRGQLLTQVELIRDAMVHAHLLSEVNRRGLALSNVYTQAIANLQKLLDLDTVRELQDLYETRALRVLNDAADHIEIQLRTVVNDLVKNGAPVRRAVIALNKAFANLGITPGNSFQIESIYRTQVQLAYSAGQWQQAQDPVYDEIIWGYKYVSVGDSRVRPIHEALDGVTLPKNDPFWQTFWPPNGYGCRCQAIPIFEQREEVRPPNTFEGQQVLPDEGFRFNPGELFSRV